VLLPMTFWPKPADVPNKIKKPRRNARIVAMLQSLGRRKFPESQSDTRGTSASHIRSTSIAKVRPVVLGVD
jgi:hypothetical protein